MTHGRRATMLAAALGWSAVRRTWVPAAALGLAACGDDAHDADGANDAGGAPESGTQATATSPASSSSGSTIAADTTAAAPPRMPALLVDNAAWVPVEAAADDPIAEHRPALVDCGATGAYAEDLAYEIDTTRCNYLARVQPSLVELRAGDRVFVAAFHDTLVAVEAGQAHFALVVGSTVVWQEFVPIPASPGVVDATPFQEEVPIDFDAPAGTPVGLHLHNHGYNNWTLLEVEARPAEAP